MTVPATSGNALKIYRTSACAPSAARPTSPIPIWFNLPIWGQAAAVADSSTQLKQATQRCREDSIPLATNHFVGLTRAGCWKHPAYNDDTLRAMESNSAKPTCALRGVRPRKGSVIFILLSKMAVIAGRSDGRINYKRLPDSVAHAH
jgi:hypothetical protein